MEQLDAALDDLLDDNDELVGLVKDVKEVEKSVMQVSGWVGRVWW